MQKLKQDVLQDFQKLHFLPAVTLNDIAQHNTAEDAWILIDAVVYNVTTFHKVHPGGSLLVLKYAGKDATEDFKMMHPLSTLQKYDNLRVARLDIESLTRKDKQKLIAKCAHERWLPFTDHYWLDPRQTLKSPYYEEKHFKWQRKVRHFIETEVQPHVDAWDEAGKFPDNFQEKAYKAGLYGAMWPQEYGGTPPEGGWDTFMDFILMYEVSNCGSGGLVSSWFLTANIALPPILNASKKLKDYCARDVISGKKIAALCITEPWAGSDVANLRCTAVDMGDHFLVNGEKKFITGGMSATYFTVAVRTDPKGHGHHGISLLLLEWGMPGFDRRKMKTMGWWAGNTAYLIFENVRVPKENLIGEINQGFKYIMNNFNHERFAMCVGSAVAGHKSIRSAIQFARVRKTFGKRLIDHQVIRHKIADMAMRTEAHYAFCEQVAYMMNNGVPAGDIASRLALLKVNGTQLCEFVAREAAQILGGNSYVRQGHGQRVERGYREVRVAAIGGGSEEVMRDFAIRMAKL